MVTCDRARACLAEMTPTNYSAISFQDDLPFSTFGQTLKMIIKKEIDLSNEDEDSSDLSLRITSCYSMSKDPALETKSSPMTKSEEKEILDNLTKDKRQCPFCPLKAEPDIFKSQGALKFHIR